MSNSKTFYHSAMVREGDMEITPIVNEPEPSKFDKKKLQIAFKYNGDTYYYPIENKGCGESLSGFKGQTITIRAEGRDEDALIVVTDAPPQSRYPEAQRGTPPPQRQQQNTQRQAPPSQRQQQPRRTPEEKAADEENAFKKLRGVGARVAVALESSIRFAIGVCGKMEAEFESGAFRFSAEDIRAIAMTHFIETKSYVDVNALPIQYPERAPQAQPARQPAPQRQPEPEPEPPQEPEENPDESPDDVPW